MPTEKPKKSPPVEPKKEEQAPQRNLPGVIGDPNHPTDPGHREFETPRTPEFQPPNSPPLEVEPPKA